MKLIKADPSLVSKPKFVVSCFSKQQTENLVKQFSKSGNIGEHYVPIVSSDVGFVAVDNIEVLDAAIKSKIKKINLLHMGKADPLLVHLRLASSKTMTNPARVKIALDDFTKNNAVNDTVKDAVKSFNLNSYLEKIISIQFDHDVLEYLADMIDTVFVAGIKLSPPLPFFYSLSKLEPTQQMTVIERTIYNAEELKMKYFRWPDTHIISHMLDDKYDSPAKPKEMIAKGIPAFDCMGCGKHYGVINNEICILEKKHGCMVVKNKMGTIIHHLPESITKFLGLGREPPRFSKHTSMDDLKKLDIKGPFIIGRPKDK